MPLKTVRIKKRHRSVSLGHKKNLYTCTIVDAVNHNQLETENKLKQYETEIYR
jgi:hypothetical protein